MLSGSSPVETDLFAFPAERRRLFTAAISDLVQSGTPIVTDEVFALVLTSATTVPDETTVNSTEPLRARVRAVGRDGFGPDAAVRSTVRSHARPQADRKSTRLNSSH